jgi:hypothetical protein
VNHGGGRAIDEAARPQIPDCSCGTELAFRYEGGHVRCWCPTCKKRSERGDEDSGHVVFVYGYGITKTEAAADWAAAANAF